MKRTITLIRHADSDWGSSELSDFDRPLNHRGNHDAEKMGTILKERGNRFEKVLTSPAKRAITTARAICTAMEYPANDIIQLPELYLASASEMLKIIHTVDDDIQHLALVAHNPGITSLANTLGDSMMDDMPTCCIAIVTMDLLSWSGLECSSGHISDFLYPKLF